MTEGTGVRPDLIESVRRALGEGGALALGMAAFRPRAAQQGLAASIADAIVRRSSLVAEAGTGTGKTFAYLVPLLLAGRKALVSTGTRPLQDQLHGRDLPAVQAALSVGLTAALLKGRSNYVCPHHLKRHLDEGRFVEPTTPVKLRRIQRFAAVSRSGDRAEFTELPEDDPAWAYASSTRENCLGQDCPELSRCFVLRARREALAADLVVVNHHLFCADLALRDDAIAQLLPSADVVVFDEAHQLPEVATEFFGDALSTRQLLDLSRDLLRSGLASAPDGADWRALADRLEDASRGLRLALEPDRAPGRGGARAAGERLAADRLRGCEPFEEALDRMLSDLVSVSAIVAVNAGRAPDLDRCGLRATELVERLQRWVAGLRGGASDAGEASADVVWAQTAGAHATLHRTPLSVADAFSRHRAGPPRAWVFLSATLAVGADFGHFVESLGLQDARCERWDSPFDFAHQAALWIPRAIGAPSEPGFAARVAQAAWPLLVANRGRAFFLCTTLRAVRELSLALRALEASTRTGIVQLVQGEAPRAVLLERFRRESAAVLIGSASFWEGVDVAGAGLSLVVIDKLPFAPPDDPVIKARHDALRRAGRDPFNAEQLPAAALALKQGAGRLIRSETDRGVLVICDERLVTRAYGRRLIASLPAFRRVERWEDAAGFLPPLEAT